MEDEDCVSKMFEYLKIVKVKPKWTKLKSEPVIAEIELKFFAHIASGFDSWITSKNVPIWCRINIPIISVRGLVTVRNFGFF